MGGLWHATVVAAFLFGDMGSRMECIPCRNRAATGSASDPLRTPLSNAQVGRAFALLILDWGTLGTGAQGVPWEPGRFAMCVNMRVPCRYQSHVGIPLHDLPPAPPPRPTPPRPPSATTAGQAVWVPRWVHPSVVLVPRALLSLCRPGRVRCACVHPVCCWHLPLPGWHKVGGARMLRGERDSACIYVCSSVCALSLHVVWMESICAEDAVVRRYLFVLVRSRPPIA